MRRTWLWLLVPLFVLPLARPLLDRADTVGYLAPVISWVTDGDSFYLDEYCELGLNERYFRPTASGLPGNHWSIGWSLLMLPIYRLAAWCDPSAQVLSPLKTASLQAMSLAWALVLLYGLSRLVEQTIGTEEATPWWARLRTLVPIALYLGTPLFFYTHVQPFRPHLLEAALATLLAWWSVKWHGPDFGQPSPPRPAVEDHQQSASSDSGHSVSESRAPDLPLAS